MDHLGAMIQINTVARLPPKRLRMFPTSKLPGSPPSFSAWRVCSTLSCCPLGERGRQDEQITGDSMKAGLPPLLALPAHRLALSAPSYFPPRSTLSFSFSFICLMVGSRGVSPVVWVVVAGGALFGTELCSWGCVAGRVAVADGGELDCAFAASSLKRKTPASSDTASVVVVVGFMIWLLSDR
jgi:hypothetical protein